MRKDLTTRKLQFRVKCPNHCNLDFLNANNDSSKLRASPPMKTTKFLICAISIAAAFAAGRAEAQTLNAKLIDYDPQLTISGTVNDGATIIAYPSGVMNFQNLDNATTFQAFCVEPLQDLFYGDELLYQIQDIGTLSQPVLNGVEKLVGGFLVSVQDAANAAAVQWAIWELTTESLATAPRSLSTGNVRITIDTAPSTIDLGNQYLANINTFTPATLTYLTNSGRQDVVTWNVIPEPSAACLAALSALALFRRRRV